jgi:hypothetical protein
MTCAIGYVTQTGEVWIGCDTAIGAESLAEHQSKLFSLNCASHLKLWVAASGSGRIIQLIKHGLDIGDIKLASDSVGLESFLSTDFTLRIVKLLSEYGCLERTNDGKAYVDVDMLVATPNMLYRLNGAMMHWAIHGSPCLFTAIGSGSEYALGSMHIVTQSIPQEPEQCIQVSLGTAAAFLPDSVRAPFQISKIEQEKRRNKKR